MTDRQKFHILDDFAPRVGNVEFKLSSICERTRVWLGSYKR